MSKKISLRQFLMRSGRFEKIYDCDQAIRNGKVSINNKTVIIPNYFFNPKKALVRLDSQKIKQVAKLYFLLNKPAGFLSQKSPNEKTVYDLLKKSGIDDQSKNSLFAIGRLDKETEGLIVITNDGRFSETVMKPENEISKRYYAVLEKAISHESIKLLEKGVVIETDEGKYKTKKSMIKAKSEKEIYISITEGRKRQIRKMFEAIGNKVIYLNRVSIGGLQLGNLKVGEIRQITRDEIIEKLFQ